MAWGRRGGGGREKERERETGESRGEMYVGPPNRIPIRPLKLITSTTCVYFPLVLLPVRSSLSFPSHTSPFFCTLNLAHEIYFCCFICHQNIQKWWFLLLWGTFGYTPTISAYMGLDIYGQEGGLVPSVQCFSLKRHFDMTNPFLHMCFVFD